MKLEDVKDKIDEYFDNISDEEFVFALINNKIPIIPDIIWVNNNKEQLNNFKSYYYEDIHLLRKNYNGRSYVYFPFNFNDVNHTFKLVNNVDNDILKKCIPDFIDGYFIMSKRGIKLLSNKFRYFKTSLIKEIMLKFINNYICYLNNENVC